jgi:hypothetical protein
MNSRSEPEHVGGRVSEYRDMMVLKWLGEQYAARIDHIEELIGRSRPRAWRIVKRLREAGLVRTRSILVGEPMWVLPTRAGLRACGLTYRELLPKSTNLAHVAAVADVRLYIQGRAPETRWVSERQLFQERRWKALVPDGLAIYEGRRVAIEVELKSKYLATVRAKLDEHERAYDGITYFCAGRPYRQLTTLIESGRWPNLEVRELPKPEAGERL